MNETIEITADTPAYMRREGWTLAGYTNDRTILSEIKNDYAPIDVAFTRGSLGKILYWTREREAA